MRFGTKKSRPSNSSSSHLQHIAHLYFNVSRNRTTNTCLFTSGMRSIQKFAQWEQTIFDRSLVEAVQGIALSGDFRLPFAQILEYFIIL